MVIVRGDGEGKKEYNKHEEVEREYLDGGEPVALTLN